MQQPMPRQHAWHRHIQASTNPKSNTTIEFVDKQLVFKLKIGEST